MQRIHFMLFREGMVRNRTALGKAEIMRLSERVHEGPLHYSLDGRPIGRLTSVVVSEVEGKAQIECTAEIDDPELALQPWLKLDQIARASVWFSLGTETGRFNVG